MAANEGSSKGFAKVFHKKVHRTKEKVLHSLGKADRTSDAAFDDHVHNFQQQQAVASKLQKELKNYINCVKAMQNASTSFYTTVREIWEVEWSGYAEMRSALEQLSFVWEDHLDRLNSEVQTPLSIYLAHFPELRSKISKRGRKLVDFDSARHNVESQENAKKRDEMKILKAQEERHEAEQIYNTMNVELHNELPTFYSNRINNLASCMNSFFSVESKFQEESAKIKTAMAKTADDLQREYHNGILSTPQIAKTLRNGNMEEDDTVDLSRNELSPMATPGRYGEESPSSSLGGGRRHSDKNSYRRSSSASQSSASDRGGQTPVSRPRGSSQSVGKEDTGPDTDSSKQNSLVREAPKASEENAYEDFNYDDGSYEAVNIRSQIEGASVGESSDTAPSQRPDKTNSRPPSSNPGDDNNVTTTTTTEVVSPPSPAQQRAPPPKPRLRLDEEENGESEDEEEEDVYKIPRSNEPVASKIPAGVEVLYKTINKPTTVTSADKSGVMATKTGSELNSSLAGDQPNNNTNHDYLTIVPGKTGSVYEQQQQPGFGGQLASSLITFGTVSTPGSSAENTGSFDRGSKAIGNYSLGDFASFEKNSNKASEVPPPVPKRNFDTPSPDVRTMLSKSRENLQTPSLIAAEQEVEAIFSHGEPWQQKKDASKASSAMPKNAKPPRTRVKSGSGPGNMETIGETTATLATEDKDAIESFAQLESVFDQIDPFGPMAQESGGDDLDAFPNGGQTPVQKDPFAGADPFANETPSPVFVNQSKSPASLFDPFEPFGSAEVKADDHDPFLPHHASVGDFDPLADGQFENSFTESSSTVGVTETQFFETSSTPKSEGVNVSKADDSLTMASDTNKTQDGSDLQNVSAIRITVTREDSPIQNPETFSLSSEDKDITTDLSNNDLDPRFAKPDGKEGTEQDNDVADASGNILYRVQATHNYTGEDTDELSFESGEIVCVTPFADPEDQDDGWLYGIKEVDGEKGVFPANFTRRL